MNKCPSSNLQYQKTNIKIVPPKSLRLGGGQGVKYHTYLIFYTMQFLLILILLLLL